MSLQRTCPNCFRKENIRFNFGNDREAEIAFHQEKWCTCDYETPEEMMKDQDLGFDNPAWVPIAKYFLENYHNRLMKGNILSSNDELTRFFLKLLKSSANNYGLSLELVDKKEGEEYKLIFEGKPDKQPRTDIFKRIEYEVLRKNSNTTVRKNLNNKDDLPF